MEFCLYLRLFYRHVRQIRNCKFLIMLGKYIQKDNCTHKKGNCNKHCSKQML